MLRWKGLREKWLPLFKVKGFWILFYIKLFEYEKKRLDPYEYAWWRSVIHDGTHSFSNSFHKHWMLALSGGNSQKQCRASEDEALSRRCGPKKLWWSVRGGECDELISGPLNLGYVCSWRGAIGYRCGGAAVRSELSLATAHMWSGGRGGVELPQGEGGEDSLPPAGEKSVCRSLSVSESGPKAPG